MVEVFEHFLDPRSTMIELSKVVTREGNVIITTPSALGITKLIQKSLHFNESKRQTYLLISGKRFPHRDFTYDEILFVTNGYFKPVNFYSFNIDPALMLTHFFANNSSDVFFVGCWKLLISYPFLWNQWRYLETKEIALIVIIILIY